MKKYFRFAGVDMALEIPDAYAKSDERLLAAFRVEKVTDPHRFTFSVQQELTPPEAPLLSRQPGYCVYGDERVQIRYLGAAEDPYMRVTHCGKQHAVQLKQSAYPNGITARTLLNAIAAEHLVAQNNGFVFHCSYIAAGQKAILFTAPSETGKTTQAQLWHTYRDAMICNGDRAAVRIEGDRILACGIPFAGSSNYCENVTLPLAAIVYLSQAKSTSIRKLTGYEAFSGIWEGVSVNTWDKTDMAAVSRTVEAVASRVPVYHLSCTPDISAVLALEGVL